MRRSEEVRGCPVARRFGSRNQPKIPHHVGIARLVREGTLPPLAGSLSPVTWITTEARG